MARKKGSRSMNTHRSSGWRTAQSAGRLTEKAAVGLFRWVSTDHTGFSESLRHIPPMGAGDLFKPRRLYRNLARRIQITDTVQYLHDTL